MGVFHVFKLCKWYQIAQNMTYRKKSAASRIFAYSTQKHKNNDQLKLITLCSAFITDWEKSHKLLHNSLSKRIIVLTILKSKELISIHCQKSLLTKFYVDMLQLKNYGFTTLNPFSTNVPLTDKPGSWFSLAKCLKNTCGRVTF